MPVAIWSKSLGALGVLCLLGLPPAGGNTWRLVEEQAFISPRVNVVQSLVVDGNGSIYVAQPNQQSIAVFDASGRLTREVGRRGDGPGDLRAVKAIGLLGDTLWISDPILERTTLFNQDGSLIRSLKIKSPSDFPRYLAGVPSGFMADGTAIVEVDAYNDPLRGTAVTRAPVVRVDRDGNFLDTLGWRSIDHSRLNVTAGEGRGMFGRQPIDDGTIVKVDPDGTGVIFVDRLTPGRFTVTRVGATGDTISRVSATRSVRALGSAFRDSVIDETTDRAMQGRGLFQSRIEAHRAVVKALYFPSSFPPVSGLVVGADSTVWVRLIDSGAPRVQWINYTDRGDSLRTIETGRMVKLMYARGDQLWGVIYDSLDTPTIYRYKVSKQ